MPGLNRDGRNRIRDLVESGADGEFVRAEIRRMRVFGPSGEDTWNFGKNQNFCEELRDKGYPKTATLLEKFNLDTLSDVIVSPSFRPSSFTPSSLRTDSLINGPLIDLRDWAPSGSGLRYKTQAQRHNMKVDF